MFGSSKQDPHPHHRQRGGQADRHRDRRAVHARSDLTSKNSVKVDGRIQGTLRAEGRAIIGETGVVKGDVHAVDLLVLGRLEGNVHAQRLHLQASAQIHGNIEAETLQVDPGARYQGSVTMRDAGAAPAVLPFSPSAPAADKAASTPAKA